MEIIYEEFGYSRTPAGMVAPDVKRTWSAAMIQAAKADTRVFIGEAPVRFMVIEKTSYYSKRLLVQFMVRH